MTASASSSDADRVLSVVLIDDDLIFRTGLRVWLSQQEGVTVVGEADRERTALALLEAMLAPPADDTSPLPPNLVAVVGLEGMQSLMPPSEQPVEERYGGLVLCRALRDRFPAVPILLVGNPVHPSLVEQMQQVGAKGYALKSMNPDDLLRLLYQVARGESVWSQADRIAAVLMPEWQRVAEVVTSATPFALLKRNVRQSGVRQIDAVLQDLLAELENPNLVGIDRLVVEGRCRELRTARWIVKWLLSTPHLEVAESAKLAREQIIGERRPSIPEGRQQASAIPKKTAPQPQENTQLTPMSTGSAIISAGVEATLFEGVTIKLQTPLRNLTDIPLEIDILREDKKRELLYLVVRKLKVMLEKLRQSQVTPRQLIERRSLILRDLWQSIADDFFGKYYTVQVEALEVEVVSVLSEEVPIAQVVILDQIPYATELLAHLLFQDPLMVDSVPYAAGTPEAMMRAEILLDHFIVQVANSIMQPLLNRLGDVEIIKQGFYDRQLMSSRDIAQFRNNLSWRYRFDRIVGNPVNIFESKYQLFVLQGNGIKQTSIYAPRRDELETLRGFPFLVTLALEFRDAVAPRLRAVISFVGSGLIYVLTDVVGRGIGLVVRGVIKGIGSAWQDARFSRDASRRL